MAAAACGGSSPAPETPAAPETADPVLSSPASPHTVFAPETDLLVEISVAAMAKSELWTRYGDAALAFFDVGLDLEEVRAACGYDPLAEIDTLTVGVVASTDQDVLALVEGISREKLDRCLEGLAAAAGEELSMTEGEPLWRYAFGEAEFLVGWIDDDTFAFADPIEVDEDGLAARLRGESGLEDDAEVLAVLADRVDAEAGFRFAIVPKEGSDLDRTLAMSGLAAKAAYGSVAVGEAVDLALGMKLRSADEANEVRAQLDQLSQLVAMSDHELSPLVRGVELSTRGAHILAAVSLTLDDLAAIAAELTPPEPVPSEEPAASDGPVRPPLPDDLAEYTADLDGDGPLLATLETNMGAIRCRLFEERAPRTVANFVGLARGLKPWVHPSSREVMEEPLYDGTIFHRVIPDFMIQGGDPEGTGRGGPGYRFDNEIAEGLRHDQPGTLSMANAGPDTNGSQFFITETPQPRLDGDYTVFGRCENLDVIKAIARVPKVEEGSSQPAEDVLLERVVIERADR